VDCPVWLAGETAQKRRTDVPSRVRRTSDCDNAGLDRARWTGWGDVAACERRGTPGTSTARAVSWTGRRASNFYRAPLTNALSAARRSAPRPCVPPTTAASTRRRAASSSRCPAAVRWWTGRGRGRGCDSALVLFTGSLVVLGEDLLRFRSPVRTRRVEREAYEPQGGAIALSPRRPAVACVPADRDSPPGAARGSATSRRESCWEGVGEKHREQSARPPRRWNARGFPIMLDEADHRAREALVRAAEHERRLSYRR
jgi:hypothetical protein